MTAGAEALAGREERRAGGAERPAGAASFHDVRRRLAACWAPAALADGDAEAPALERQQTMPVDPPRLRASLPVEGHAVRVRAVGSPAVDAPGDGLAFAAFLDGTQHSRPLGWPEGLPVVFGTVAAVVRERRNRRLTTWGAGPRLERRIYAPLSLLSAPGAAAVRDAASELPGVQLVDTTAPDRSAGAAPPSPHPAALVERALAMVKEDRERAEKQVAELWCGRGEGLLFVDGGIQESEIVARASCVVGVVKSHRTLYAEGDALRAVLALRVGERTTAVRVGDAAGRRVPVASWYLRLRDASGRDPMFGLVRVEVAMPDAAADPAGFTAHADAVSRAVLAEVAPVALPDGRWDRLVYGIYDCERFLRALA